MLLGGHTTDLREDTCHSRGRGGPTEGPEALVLSQVEFFKRTCPSGSILCILHVRDCLRKLLVLTRNWELGSVT